MQETAQLQDDPPPRRGTGRRLSQAGEPEAGSSSTQRPLVGRSEAVQLVDIDQENTAFQCRISTTVSDLKRSLETHGLEQPVDLVGPKPYRIVDGFRRCKAAGLLGWTEIQAVVHEMDDKQALRVAFTKNVVRKNLAPMDRANALWMAQKQGFRKSDMQDLFGLSQKQVDRYLELLAFSPALQRVLDGKTVTMAHAKVMHDFAVDGPADWKKRIETEDLSAKQLKKLLRQEGGKKQPGRKKLYLKKSKDSLRVYPFSISKDAAQAEKDKVAKLLREALEFLETK